MIGESCILLGINGNACDQMSLYLLGCFWSYPSAEDHYQGTYFFFSSLVLRMSTACSPHPEDRMAPTCLSGEVAQHIDNRRPGFAMLQSLFLVCSSAPVHAAHSGHPRRPSLLVIK